MPKWSPIHDTAQHPMTKQLLAQTIIAHGKPAKPASQHVVGRGARTPTQTKKATQQPRYALSCWTFGCITLDNEHVVTVYGAASELQL
ncbi:unnamed protein product [Phytophthora lilii]|uniref:Unnamed protein product n=1 Tax=Phytophthora lilii TaxID=2077276 RepID=A0A9W7D3G7_9STRA|nr:unnamed protein product [Phytophthora lilii]